MKDFEIFRRATRKTIAILLSTKPEQILDTVHSLLSHVYFKQIDAVIQRLERT